MLPLSRHVTQRRLDSWGKFATPQLRARLNGALSEITRFVAEDVTS